jgi:hypothetical protein
MTRGGANRPGAGVQPGRSRARELLDERYALGDITTEEYRERLLVLGEDTWCSRSAGAAPSSWAAKASAAGLPTGSCPDDAA